MIPDVSSPRGAGLHYQHEHHWRRELSLPPRLLRTHPGYPQVSVSGWIPGTRCTTVHRQPWYWQRARMDIWATISRPTGKGLSPVQDNWGRFDVRFHLSSVWLPLWTQDDLTTALSPCTVLTIGNIVQVKLVHYLNARENSCILNLTSLFVFIIEAAAWMTFHVELCFA